MGFHGEAATFFKVPWTHTARTLHLSLDEVACHEDALPLLPRLGHVSSWPFNKMATTSLLSGNEYTAGPQKSSQSESGPCAEAAGTDLPPAGEICPWEEEGVADNMPIIPCLWLWPLSCPGF